MVQKEKFAIGVDIGGTKIAFALVDNHGQVLASHRLPTLPQEGSEAVLDRVAEGVQHLLAQTDQPVSGVGIGCPGLVNPLTGVVLNATNLGWRHVALGAGVQARLSRELAVHVGQDVNVAALGEMYFGVANGERNFVYLAVGTGLGGGAVVNGKLLEGGQFTAMEVGHMPLDPHGRLCACGMRGCPEMYLTGVGLLAGVKAYLPDYPGSILALLPEITTDAIIDAARKQDELALVVIHEAAQWLTSVMVCCIGILNPTLFVIGGGLGHAYADLVLPLVEQELETRSIFGVYPKVEMLLSRVTSSAVGPACLVLFPQEDYR